MNFSPAPATPAPPPKRGLRHNYLSFLEDTAQTLGVMAPTGTLGIILPLLIAKGGNTTWITFSITLIAFSLIMFCVYRFSQHHASAGAIASFADAGLGRWPGVIAGWCYVAAMGFGVASVAPSSAYYADLVITQITGVPGSIARGALITSAVIIVAALIAYRDIKLSTELMLAIEFASLAAIILIVAFAMFHYSAWIDRPQLHLEGAHLPGFQYALVFGFMTLAGFESVTALGAEASHAKRTIPKVILGCLIPIGILYLVVIYCLVALARKNGMIFDQLNAPFDTIARSMNLGSLGYLSSIGVSLSYFACTLGSMNAGARVLYSMARRNQFAPGFGIAHPRERHPFAGHYSVGRDRHRDSRNFAADARFALGLHQLRHATHVLRFHLFVFSGLPRTAVLLVPSKTLTRRRRHHQCRRPADSHRRPRAQRLPGSRCAVALLAVSVFFVGPRWNGNFVAIYSSARLDARSPT